MTTYRGKPLVILLALALMSACGGGGSSGDGTPPLGTSWRWTATPVVAFSQGMAGTVDLASFISNPTAIALTYSVASGTLPGGVTLSSSRVMYDGAGVQATSMVAFRATYGAEYVDSSSTSVEITLAADTVAPTVPQGLTVSDVMANSITLNWSASTDPLQNGQVSGGVASYSVYRNGDVLPWSGLLTQYIDSVSPLTSYTYRVSAVDVAGNESGQSSPASATTPGGASGVMYWQDGFEAGSTSSWGGTSGSGWTVLSNGQAYNGAYHIAFPLTNGTINDMSVFHDYGTPTQVGTQVRNFYAQFAVSHGGTFGISAGEAKLCIFQYYRSTSPSFANVNRKYQVIPAVVASGDYAVFLVEMSDSGSFLRNAPLLQNTTSYGPADSPSAWDVLRLQVQLDTNGSQVAGEYGVGHGNGIVRLWRNNTLIVEYTNLNIVRGEADVGIGRILLTPSHQPYTWTAPSTAIFYDRFQVSYGSDALDSMPANARPR